MKAKRFEGLTAEECINRRDLFDKEDEKLVLGLTEHLIANAPKKEDVALLVDLYEIRDTLTGLYQLARSASKHVGELREAIASQQST